MKRLALFGRFWYDFIIGDDWRLALGVVVTITVVFVAAHHGVDWWWLLPGRRRRTAHGLGDPRRPATCWVSNHALNQGLDAPCHIRRRHLVLLMKRCIRTVMHEQERVDDVDCTRQASAMQLTVFGATGRTGSASSSRRSQPGTRSPRSCVTRAGSPFHLNTKVNVITADVMDSVAIEPAVKGADAVLSTLGSKRPVAAQIRSPATAPAASSRRWTSPTPAGWSRSPARWSTTRATDSSCATCSSR